MRARRNAQKQGNYRSEHNVAFTIHVTNISTLLLKHEHRPLREVNREKFVAERGI